MSQSVELVFEDSGVRTIVSSAHPLPTSSGAGGSDATAANQVTQITALQIIDDLPIAQGAALGSNKQVLSAGSVTTAAPTYTTGQISPVSLDTAGGLRVVQATTTVGGAATIPAGTNAIGSIINVSGTVSLPTGASTETSAAAAATSLALIDDLPVAQATALGSIKQVMVGGSVTTAAPTYTTGNINPISLDTSGRIRVNASTTTVTYKILATGQLASSKGTLYTVPASTVAHVRLLRCVSTGTGQTVKIYTKKSGGSSRLLGPYAVITTGEAYVVLTEGEQLDLAAGDLIEGETTGATTVDYTITGSEEV